MSKNCKTYCDAHGEKVQKLAHAKEGVLHILSGPENMEGLIPAVFKASADYAVGDRFRVNSEAYTLVLQDGQELRSGFFKKGTSVSVLVDAEGKCLAFASGNGAKKLPTAAAGHILVGGEDGDPADSGKTVNDFDAAGSAQAVQGKLDEHKSDEVAHVTASERESWNAKVEQSELAQHEEDTTIHVAQEERQAWNSKADRATGAAVGNLAALDAMGNPVDSGFATEDINARVPNPTDGNLTGMDGAGKLINSNIAADDVLLAQDLTTHNAAEDAHAAIRTILSNKAERILNKELRLPLLKGFSDDGQGVYWKDQFGQVTVRGYIRNDNAAFLAHQTTSFAILPEEFRPARVTIGFAMPTAKVADLISAFVQVSKDGQVGLGITTSGYSSAYFEVTFLAAQ